MKFAPTFQTEKNPAKLTRKLHELMYKVTALEQPYKQIFKGMKEADDELESCIKDAWNDKESFDVIPTFCLYLHQNIQSEFKTFSQEEKDAFPEIFGKFYARTQERLEFNHFYEKKYVRRFVKMGLKLHEIEGPLIAQVQKIAKAPDFSRSFETYFQKIKDSTFLADDFKNYQRANRIEFKFSDIHPIIFDSRGFPITIIKLNNIPQELKAIHDAFKASYIQSHANTELTLLADLSTVEIKLRVPKNGKVPARSYTLTTDLLAASILSSVATSEKTYGEIIQEIGEEQRSKIGL